MAGFKRWINPCDSSRGFRERIRGDRLNICEREQREKEPEREVMNISYVGVTFNHLIFSASTCFHIRRLRGTVGYAPRLSIKSL